VSLVPVPSEQPSATCANCGAELVADQRYCLSCGQPVSPVRLAFLDVLGADQSQSQHQPGSALAAPPAWAPRGGAVEVGPWAYAQLPPEQGAGAWLRRYSGLLSLLSVLVLCLLVGLLVGHWVTQGRSTSSGPQVIKVEGLAAAPTAAATTTPSSSPAVAGKANAAREEAEEAKEAAKETKAEKAPPPAPVKVAPSKLRKLSTTTGKKHEEEVNALGAQPIETG
jgi:hypothetical protein